MQDDTCSKLVYPWSRIACFAPLWVGSLAEFSIVSGLIFTSVFLPQYIKGNFWHEPLENPLHIRSSCLPYYSRYHKHRHRTNWIHIHTPANLRPDLHANQRLFHRLPQIPWETIEYQC